MSDEELRDQINKIAVEIEKIEQVAKQKEIYIRNKLKEEFDPKISEIEVKLQNHQHIFNELVNKINELTLKKKELTHIIKNLENEYNTLKKSRDKTLNEKLKAITKEKKTKTKVIDQNIKILEKELKASETK
ncbi:MAG: hypothetical protein ACFE9N_04460 [Promethearchaeota archaeon]